MIDCTRCGGTGKEPDEGLREFLRVTETRDPEELMMRALEPRLFDHDHVMMMYELAPAETPFKLHVLEDESMAPGTWRVAQVPPNTWEQLPRPDTGGAGGRPRTGADFFREQRERPATEGGYILPPNLPRERVKDVEKLLQDAGKKLGFM